MRVRIGLRLSRGGRGESRVKVGLGLSLPTVGKVRRNDRVVCSV